jgi:hypothetical protein
VQLIDLRGRRSERRAMRRRGAKLLGIAIDLGKAGHQSTVIADIHDKSILPDTGSDSDFSDMMDHDASKFVEAPVVDGESLAKDADAIGEALDESPAPTKAPASSSSDKSDSSDAQPDGITLLRNQAQQFGYTAEDVQSLDEPSLRQLLDVQSDLMGRVGPPPQQFAPQQWPQQMQPGLFDANQIKAAMECVREQIERRRIETKK